MGNPIIPINGEPYVVCTMCGTLCESANAHDGHVRNVHGWKPTECGCVLGGKRCAAHALPARCTFALPGMGRCMDTSGIAHGHHFRPGQVDLDLAMTDDEMRELVAYLRDQYLNRNKWPKLSALYDRLERYVSAVVQ